MFSNDAGDELDGPIPYLVTGKREPCTDEQHAVIKASIRNFRAFTRERGRQDNGAGGWLLLGNCRCGTTLAICAKCGVGDDGCTCHPIESDRLENANR